MTPRAPVRDLPPTEPIKRLAERFARFAPKRILDSGQARAAVALVLRKDDSQLQVLLILRAVRRGDPWSGQVGLPGGRSSPADESLLDTARRETLEEVGLCLTSYGRLLGSLDDLPAAARGRHVPLVITPFVFELVGQGDLTKNPSEVDEAFWAAVDELRSSENQTTYSLWDAGHSLEFPAIRVGRHLVWGLTLRMLNALFQVMGGGSIEVRS